MVEVTLGIDIPTRFDIHIGGGELVIVTKEPGLAIRLSSSRDEPAAASVEILVPLDPAGPLLARGNVDEGPDLDRIVAVIGDGQDHLNVLALEVYPITPEFVKGFQVILTDLVQAALDAETRDDQSSARIAEVNCDRDILLLPVTPH